MPINQKDFEVPFYLVLEDDDLKQGLDEVTSKIKKTGKIVETEFIRKFEDAKDQFQAIVKFGNQAYSILGKLTKKGEVNVKSGLKATPLSDSQALQMLNQKTFDKYKNKLRAFEARANDIRKKKEEADAIRQANEAKKEQAKLDNKANKEAEKEASAKLKLSQAQELYNNEMQRYINILKNKDYKSVKEFKGIGSDISKQTTKASKTEDLDTSLGAQALALYNQRQEEYIRNTSKIGEIFRGVLPPIHIAKLELSQVRDRMREVEEELLLIGDAEGASQLKQELKDLAKEAEKLEKKSQLSGIQKLFNTFKRVGFYRIARRVFSLIEQGFGQSLKSLSMFDSGINQSMSQITSSFSVISSSIIGMIGPILDTIAPIMQQIASGIAGIANGFNKANAQAKGLTKYTKVNADYMKDFANDSNSALLSFDKFESLSANDPLSGVYTQGDVSEELKGDGAEFGGELYKTLQLLLDIVSKIWDIASPLIDDVLNLINPILSLVNVLLTYLEPLLKSIFEYVGGILKNFSGILDVVVGIIYILTGDFDKAWEHIDSGFKKMVQGWLDSLIAMLNMVIDLINILFADTNPVFWVLRAFGVDVSKVRIPHIPSPQLFENGGMPQHGSLFVAGEAGAEFVTRMPSGQTGVTNIVQFKQATLEALYEWWYDARDDLPEGGSFNIDGAQIARSKSFISEVNRRNAGLNLK